MPVESSVEASASPALEMSLRRRLAMVAMAYLPLLHCGGALSVAICGLLGFGPRWLLLAALAILYLLPPLMVAPLRLRSRFPQSRCSLQSGEFLGWWWSVQWQTAFNRLPLLEELLRLVPGLYSAWLRLWGARVGKLVYWSPGMRVCDRPFLEIGDHVVIGLDAKLYAHFIARPPDGAAELHLAPIRIGRDALIGGCSLLSAGVEIAACEQTPAARPLAPFSRFVDGRSHRTLRFSGEMIDE